jgi:hypothetical protein
MQSLSGVRSVEPFGSAWHLRVERRESVAEVIEALVSMGIDRADVGVTEPTLEDVFLEVVGGAR